MFDTVSSFLLADREEGPEKDNFLLDVLDGGLECGRDDVDVVDEEDDDESLLRFTCGGENVSFLDLKTEFLLVLVTLSGCVLNCV